MFCPSCGTRNPDVSRFCGSCGADLSGRRAGSPAAQAAAQVPASRAPIPARRAPAARIRVVAGIAAAVAVALIVAVGLSTGWFGFAKPHLTPGTYTYTYTYPSINSDLSTTSSDASLTAAISVSQGDRVSFTVLSVRPPLTWQAASPLVASGQAFLGLPTTCCLSTAS